MDEEGTAQSGSVEETEAEDAALPVTESVEME